VLQTTIWATCGLAHRHPIYSAFDALGKQLRRSGIELFLFTQATLENCDGVSAVVVPLSVSALLSGPNHAVTDQLTLQELTAIERAWGFGGEASLVARGMNVWDAIAELTQPCAILSWHTTSPLSHVQRRIADRRRTPWWSLELGPLPQTLDLSFGQVFRANLAASITMRRADYTDEALAVRVAEIRAYYTQLAERHYPEHNLPVAADRASLLLRPRRPKVLYIGSSDAGCGAALSPPHASAGAGERCSPFVSSSQGALDHLGRALAAVAPGATLWVRPHPGHALSLEALASLNIQVEVTATEDLTWLMQHADLSACVASNAQLQLTLWGKPQISFASGYLTGRGVAYEARSAEELERCLKEALSGKDWDARKRRGEEAIALLFDRQLVGNRDETPTRLKLGDLADLLSSFRDFAPAIARDDREMRKAVQDLIDGATHDTAIVTRSLSQRVEELERLKTLHEAMLTPDIATDPRVKGIVSKIRSSPWRATKELPHGFNPLNYVAFSKDLFDAGVDPFEHYLRHGFRENRRW
jgi:hypothetical protein